MTEAKTLRQITGQNSGIISYYGDFGRMTTPTVETWQAVGDEPRYIPVLTAWAATGKKNYYRVSSSIYVDSVVDYIKDRFGYEREDIIEINNEFAGDADYHGFVYSVKDIINGQLLFVIAPDDWD